MRLIQPTLLLLLLAIHGESCIGPISGNSQEDTEMEKLMNCLAEKCPTEKAACQNKPKCMDDFKCIVNNCKNNLVVCGQDCVPDAYAQTLLQCSVDQKCIPHTEDTCPGETDEQKQKPDNPDLLQQMANKTWYALMTVDPDKRGLLNYPCSSLFLSWDGKNVRLVYKNCFGNSTLGKCLTNYTTTIGIGNQRGNREIIDLDLVKKDFLLDGSKLTIHVHKLIPDELAFLTFCLTDDTTILSSKVMIFSTRGTYRSVLHGGKDPEHVMRKLLLDSMNDVRHLGVYYHHMGREYCPK